MAARNTGKTQAQRRDRPEQKDSHQKAQKQKGSGIDKGRHTKAGGRAPAAAVRDHAGNKSRPAATQRSLPGGATSEKGGKGSAVSSKQRQPSAAKSAESRKGPARARPDRGGQSGGASNREEQGNNAGNGGEQQGGNSVVEKLKQHPIAAAGAAAAAAAGVGLGVMVVQGVRQALRGDRGRVGGRQDEDQAEGHERDTSEEEVSAAHQEGGEEGQQDDAGEDDGGDAGEDDDEDDEAAGEGDEDVEASAASADNAGEGDESGDADEDGDEDREGARGNERGRRQGLSHVSSRLRDSASAAREGYQRGKQFAEESWQSHPLLIGGIALAAGAGAAMLLPTSQLEDTLIGKAADRVNDRIRQATGGLFGRGKGVLSRALSEAADAAAREAEREGLTPDRLGRKVKRVVKQIRQAVAETVDEG